VLQAIFLRGETIYVGNIIFYTFKTSVHKFQTIHTIYVSLISVPVNIFLVAIGMEGSIGTWEICKSFCGGLFDQSAENIEVLQDAYLWQC